MKEHFMIGKGIKRVDSLEKVTGRALYSFDVELPGMLYGKILRSTVPHAKILNIDISEAQKLPGVMLILTGKDFPPYARYGYGLMDEPILAMGKVLYVGDSVAAVAAERPDIAEEALDLIDVEYEELPPIFDPEESLRPDPPSVIHEGLKDYIKLPIPLPVPDILSPNLCAYHKVRKGDVEKGFKEADVIVENRYSTSMIQHCQLESHNCVASWDEKGELTLWTSAQSLFVARQILSIIHQIPESNVRIIVPYVGGGFGGKIELTSEVICSVLAKITGRPVKIAYTRKETFINASVRHPVITHIKDGVKKDGTIIAREMRLIFDGGAYSKTTPFTVRNSSLAATSTYRIPNFKLDSCGVYTNKPSAGAFRGFGCSQVCYAVESQMDEIAHKIGMDPAEIRLKNALEEGEKNIIDEVVISDGTKECIKKVKEAMDKKRSKEKIHGVWRRGVGYACGNKNSLAPTIANAYVRVNGDETVDVYTAALELGQGGHTAMLQIAAEEFKLPVEKIKLITGDTRVVPFDHGAFSSRQTFNTGNAIRLACIDAKQQLFESAAKLMEARAEDLDTGEGKIFVKGNPEKSIRISQLFMPALGGMLPIHGKEFFGRGTWVQEADLLSPETGLIMGANPIGRPVAFYIFNCHAVEIEVNIETGEIRILKYISANDVGKAINPDIVHRQAEGGAVMGIGSALYEELVFDNGNPINPNFSDYKIPTAKETPYIKDFESIIVEAYHKDGPYGAKGVGEAVMIPTAAAISNALYDAIGIRIPDIPLTPERVWRAIKEKGVK